jgi:hypothetical protein
MFYYGIMSSFSSSFHFCRAVADVKDIKTFFNPFRSCSFRILVYWEARLKGAEYRILQYINSSTNASELGPEKN